MAKEMPAPALGSGSGSAGIKGGDMKGVQFASPEPTSYGEEPEPEGSGLGEGDEQGLSKLQQLRNQFRTKIVAEKERKLKLLHRKEPKQSRKVTINGYVEEFSPVQSNRALGPDKQRHESVTKESLKSPGLGQRMQTDLAKIGNKQPSQKELEVRRRQAILDGLHKKETERKKLDANYPIKSSGKNPSRSFKNQLPPIPGSVKKQTSEASDLSEVMQGENENPFTKKPAMIRKKPLPGVRGGGGGGATKENTEESGWTSENTSDKENTQVSVRPGAVVGVGVSPRVQPIAEAERQPLQESRSSNNDSAGTTGHPRGSAGDLTQRNEDTENAPPHPQLGGVKPNSVVDQSGGESQQRAPTPSRPTTSAQSHRSVTARDVLMLANDNQETDAGPLAELRSEQRKQQKQRTTSAYVKSPVNGRESAGPEKDLKRRSGSAHHVVLSDTITDLESGQAIEPIEKQRLEALQKLNKKTQDERAKSAKIREQGSHAKHDDSHATPTPNDTQPGDGELNVDAKLDFEAQSDNELSAHAMTLRDRQEISSLRRTESYRPGMGKPGIKHQHSSRLKNSNEVLSTPKKAAPSSASQPLSVEAISEMKKREKDLIEAIRKQQFELEQVRKQRYRQERIFKTAVHKKTEKIRGESDSSRVLSTEEGGSDGNHALEAGTGSTEKGDHITHSYHFPNNDLPPSKKKPHKPKLPPKRSLDIKEDPYYAQIAEKSTPQSIDMSECEYCQRSFAPERLLKHQEICQSLKNKKRGEFDASKRRLQGTGAEIYQPVGSTDQEQGEANGPPPIGTSKQQPSQMIKCHTCGKHFPFHSAERHMPVCKKNKQAQNDQAAAATASTSNNPSASTSQNFFVTRV